jgi:hypothetical protein
MGECTASMGAGIGGLTDKTAYERNSATALDNRQLSSINANTNFADDGRNDWLWDYSTKTY